MGKFPFEDIDRKQRILVVLVFALGLLGVNGCGGSAISLTGKVAYRNRPLPNASVRFVSQGKSEEVFISASTDKAGKLLIDSNKWGGVPVGRYKITVGWWVLAKDGSPLPEGEQGESLKGTHMARQFSATFDEEITESSSPLTLDLSKVTIEEITE